MNKFTDFQLQAQVKGFTGDKIKMYDILNQPIVVEDYKVERSKFDGKGECLYLQITFENRKRVVFVSGVALIDVISRIPQDKFPFETTIRKTNGRYEFA